MDWNNIGVWEIILLFGGFFIFWNVASIKDLLLKLNKTLDEIKEINEEIRDFTKYSSLIMEQIDSRLIDATTPKTIEEILWLEEIEKDKKDPDSVVGDYIRRRTKKKD